MKLKKVKVVIPVYRERITNNEKISLLQCRRILNRYPLCIIKPDNLLLHIEEIQGIEIEEFDARWFQSVQTYNKLMLTEQFYKRFIDCEYILIYQLDAFVFRDELLTFCSMGYDYIGAPWVHGRFFYVNGIGRYCHTGNGGLSLRKVSSHLEVLRNNQVEDGVIEDVFFSTRESEYFQVAPIEIALKFAFEEHVRECFERNHRELPFGCHAWQRFDFSFYQKIFQDFGYDISEIRDEKLDQILCDDTCDYSELTEEKVIGALKSLLPDMKNEVWIWGAGQIGKKCGWLLKQHHIEIMGYIDSDIRTQGKYLYAKRIIGGAEYFGNVNNVPVIIAMLHVPPELTEQLYQNEKKEGKDYILWEQLYNLLKVR